MLFSLMQNELVLLNHFHGFQCCLEFRFVAFIFFFKSLIFSLTQNRQKLTINAKNSNSFIRLDVAKNRTKFSYQVKRKYVSMLQSSAF